MTTETLVQAIAYGDGWITSRGRLGMNHSLSQLPYLESKQRLLQDFGLRCACTQHTRPEHSIAGHHVSATLAVRLDTNTDPRLKLLHNQLYSNGMKQLPAAWAAHWSWPELAILYQDDGRTNRIAHYASMVSGARIRTDCDVWANRYELHIGLYQDPVLFDWLERLGLEFSVHPKKNQRDWVVWFSRAASKTLLYEMLTPHFDTSMRYKLVRPTLSYRSSPAETKRTGQPGRVVCDSPILQEEKLQEAARNVQPPRLGGE